jgi:hypothetical protein
MQRFLRHTKCNGASCVARSRLTPAVPGFRPTAKRSDSRAVRLSRRLTQSRAAQSPDLPPKTHVETDGQCAILPSMCT